MTQSLRSRRPKPAAAAPVKVDTSAEDGVTVAGLGKRYGDKWVVDDVSFAVAGGQFLSIVGPSGCGKSTSLRLIAGLDRPDSGEVRIGGVAVSSQRDGVSVPSARRNIGFVFQSYALWPHMTVFEHVAYPLHSDRMSSAAVAQRVAETLELVGLTEHKVRYPSELSGGQQQRVALARAVARRPAILLLDEPLSNLDAELRARMGGELRSLQQELHITTIYVTHDRVEALSLSDQIMVMHDGHALEFGSPHEVYEHPTNLFSARFVSGANILDGVVTAVRPDGGVLVGLAGGAAVEVAAHPRGIRLSLADEVRVAARPEMLTVVPEQPAGPNLLRGDVQSVTYFGAHSDVVVRASGKQLYLRLGATERAQRGVDVEAGKQVTLALPAHALTALPADD